MLREFPAELEACRKRHANRANTLLIVVVDADDFTVQKRRADLWQGRQSFPEDPVVALIPRRHVETWIRAALDQTVNEAGTYKDPKLRKPEVRTAANTIYKWARPYSKAGPTCVDSLRTALPEWRRIG